jgi:hypothetical protein
MVDWTSVLAVGVNSALQCCWGWGYLHSRDLIRVGHRPPLRIRNNVTVVLGRDGAALHLDLEQVLIDHKMEHQRVMRCYTLGDERGIRATDHAVVPDLLAQRAAEFGVERQRYFCGVYIGGQDPRKGDSVGESPLH